MLTVIAKPAAPVEDQHTQRCVWASMLERKHKSIRAHASTFIALTLALQLQKKKVDFLRIFTKVCSDSVHALASQNVKPMAHVQYICIYISLILID
jgi:hypothetical protein